MQKKSKISFAKTQSGRKGVAVILVVVVVVTSTDVYV
jgi:hypothetical protein